MAEERYIQISERVEDVVVLRVSRTAETSLSRSRFAGIAKALRARQMVESEVI